MKEQSTYSLIIELIERFQEDHEDVTQQSASYNPQEVSNYKDRLTDAVAALKVLRPYY